LSLECDACQAWSTWPAAALMAGSALVAIICLTLSWMLPGLVRRVGAGGPRWMSTALRVLFAAFGVVLLADVVAIQQGARQVHDGLQLLLVTTGLAAAGLAWLLLRGLPRAPAASDLHAAADALESELRARQDVLRRLADAEEGMSVTLATMGAGFVATDRLGRVTRMNEMAQRLTGWALDDAYGRGIGEVLARSDRPKPSLAGLPAEWLNDLGAGAEAARRITGVARDGSRADLEVRAGLKRADDGSVSGLVVVFRDIASVPQPGAAEKLLETLVEVSHDAIVGQAHDGRITRWNPSAERLLGYSAAQAIGQPIDMLAAPGHEDPEPRIVAMLAAGTAVSGLHTLLRTRQGQLLEVSLAAAAIRDARGRVVGLWKSIHDLGPQRLAVQAQQALEKREAENRQILEASRLKSQFFAGMSHELRTPLNAIIGFADLLQRGTVAPGEPKAMVFLGHIASSGRHLLQLINDLLDLSKIESGKFEFFPQPLDLRELLEDVTQVLGPTAAAKGISLHTELDPLLTGVQLDPVRLRQVLFNFLSNAIKFTAAGGQVTSRARVDGPLHLRIEVEDSGIGIAESEVTRLFSDFQQIDPGHNRQHEGAGLGLALTRRLVQAQGGHVGVRSALGQGSVFHAVLNRVHGTDAARRARAQQHGHGSQDLRVLVVDGDQAVQAGLSQALADDGFHVDCAASAAQAMAHAQTATYHALTLGLRLPDRPGLGVLDSLRRVGPNRDLPVIGITLPTTHGDAACFALTDLFAKPLHVDHVVAAMARWRWRTPAPARVLLIDDDAAARELMRGTLEGIGIDVVLAGDARPALRDLDRVRPDAIVTALVMPGFDGLATLHALRQMSAWRETPVYLWTGQALGDADIDGLQATASALQDIGGAGLAEMADQLRRWRPAEGEPGLH
jgi:PAS domain S-box-containing protein